jgi:hypothetical protein
MDANIIGLDLGFEDGGSAFRYAAIIIMDGAG